MVKFLQETLNLKKKCKDFSQITIQFILGNMTKQTNKNDIMKTNKLYRNAVICIITVSTALILLAAQINYKAAINAACKTDCSDMQIELAMKNYGFNVDANEIIEPSMVAKIKALFN